MTAESWADYRRNPVGFVHNFWPAQKLAGYQADILTSVADNPETFVYSGHKLGKTFCAARLDEAQCTAPKVRDSIAQGATLGPRRRTNMAALKGRDSARRHNARDFHPPQGMAPFQGYGSFTVR
jgi:hypothetical protein